MPLLISHEKIYGHRLLVEKKIRINAQKWQKRIF